MSPSGMPCLGIAGERPGPGRGPGRAAGARGHPAGQLGHGRAVLLAHHGGGGGVVAEEQLAVLAGAAAGAVPPGGFGVGAVAGAAGRRAGEGFHVGPVHRQRGAGVLELVRDGGFQQVVADRAAAIRTAARRGRPWPGRRRPGRRSARSAGRSAGAGRASSPRSRRAAAGRPRAAWSVPGGRGSGGRAGDRPARSACPAAGCGPAAAGPHPDRQQRLDPRRDARAVDDLLQEAQRDHRRPDAPSSSTASASPAGSSLATRSPSRWEQVIPAAA